MKDIKLSIKVNGEVIEETFTVDSGYSEFDCNHMLKDWLFDKFHAEWEEVDNG